MTTYLYEKTEHLGRAAPAVCQRSTSPSKYSAGLRPATFLSRPLFLGCRLFFFFFLFFLGVAHSFPILPLLKMDRKGKNCPSGYYNHQTFGKCYPVPRHQSSTTKTTTTWTWTSTRYPVCCEVPPGCQDGFTAVQELRRVVPALLSSFGKRSPLRSSFPPLSCSWRGLKTAFGRVLQAVLIQELMFCLPVLSLPFSSDLLKI
jgi:hypothetical protein